MERLPLGTGFVLYGELDPAKDLGPLLDALRTGDCLGIGGLLITEGAIMDWSPELRADVGRLLQRFPQVWAADEQTVEWGPHYGVRPKLGEHPAWVADPEHVAMAVGVEAKTYAGAVWAARQSLPFALRIFPYDGQADSKPGRPDTHHLLHRFARRYGVDDARIVYRDEPRPDWLEEPTVALERVDRACKEAQAMLDSMQHGGHQRHGIGAVLDAIEGNEVPPTGRQRRRVEPGAVFDPATHYQADYYDGTGIEYMQPDGTWHIYHGTGLRWGGNELVARFIRQVSPAQSESATVLDYGCSSGDFLSYMLRSGWRVFGYDISQEAIDRAPPDVRPYLSTKRPSELVEHLTSFDLLEHIWHNEVPRVLAEMNVLLRPGGLLWLNICTAGEGEQAHAVEPGVKFTQENSWMLVSGHVTLQRLWWWRRRLRQAGFVPRDDLANLWQVRRAEVPGFVAGTQSWSARNFTVWEKPDA